MLILSTSSDATYSCATTLYGRANTALETAVASFFTPLSKKQPEKTIWQERASDNDIRSTLLVGRYEPDNKSERLVSSQVAQRKPKVAAFDFVIYRRNQPTQFVLTACFIGFYADSNEFG